MKTTKQKRSLTPVVDAIDVPLSPQWAFLVQFRAVPGGPTYAVGRVEHLTSGRTTHFESLRELTTYLERELHATGGG